MDRRKLDERHHFISYQIGNVIGVDPYEVEELLQKDPNFSYFDDFFRLGGTSVLSIFYQKEVPSWHKDEIKNPKAEHMTKSLPTGAKSSALGKANAGFCDSENDDRRYLFLARGDKEILSGCCLFFIRNSKETAIEPSNISRQICFGNFVVEDGNVLEAVRSYLGKVVCPQMEETKNWKALQRISLLDIQPWFLRELDRFTQCLGNSSANLTCQTIKLTQIEMGFEMETTPVAEYNLLAKDPLILANMESQLLIWCKEIEQILVTSEQILCEADDCGPSSELEHWKKRTAKFDVLLSEIRNPKVRAVTTALLSVRSKTLKTWKEMDVYITDAANEARDNVRYLNTLDKYFGPLETCTPLDLTEQVPSLINTVRMIYTISRFYNTSKRMTSLFVKITNQMVSICKAFIQSGVGNIWDHSRDELIKRLDECVNLSLVYQNEFQKTKKALEKDTSQLQFQFSENYIFGRFDIFCKRISEIRHMAMTMENLSTLSYIKIQGLESFVVKYKTIAVNVKKKCYDHLDHRCQQFNVEYEEFKSQINCLQEGIQNLLDCAFKKNMTTLEALRLINKFEQIKGIKLELWEKYKKILHIFFKEIDNVKKMYYRFYKDPPIARNIPPISGRIMWSRQLWNRLETSMEALKKKNDVITSSEAKSIIKAYNTVGRYLMEYEIENHKRWLQGIDNDKFRFTSSLVVRHPELKTFHVNFDPKILELFSETRHMTKFKLEVPKFAEKVTTLDWKRLKQTYDCLTGLIRKQEKLVDEVPAILKSLMKSHICRLEEAFVPGLTSVNWNSLNSDKFIRNVEKAEKDFEEFLKRIQDMLHCRIEKLFNEMAATTLVEIPFSDPSDIKRECHRDLMIPSRTQKLFWVVLAVSKSISLLKSFETREKTSVYTSEVI